MSSIAATAIDGRRTRVRYSILAMIFVGSVINLADRANLSIAGSVMSADLGMKPVVLGYVFSAFAWAYVIAQLPAGWMLDRFGAVVVYGSAVLAWSVCTGLQGFVGALPASIAIGMLIMLRFCLGLLESPLSPGNSYIVASWFPIKERGLATAIYNSAQYVAAATFVPFMGVLVHKLGWPAMFWTMGALGIAFGVVWFRIIRAPTKHPRISPAELVYIRDGGAELDAEATKRPGNAMANLRLILYFLRTRQMIGIYIGQYCVTALQYFFLTWFPVYLIRARGMNIMDAGFAVSAPAICGFMGGLLGGWISDALTRHGFSVSVARKVPFVTGLLLAASLVFCNFVSSTAVVIALMSLAIFGKGLGAVSWAVVADTAPPGTVGFAGGVFNLFGSLSGIVTPIVIGYVVQLTGSFTNAMYFVSAHGLVGAFCFLVVIGKIRRLEPPKEIAGSLAKA